LFCNAQPAPLIREQKNFVHIDDSISDNERIKLAANIVPTPRQLRWLQFELTGFYHFGVNTFTGKEWGDGKEEPKIFNPASLDANQWEKTARQAGLKQVILTAKHHDGFCM
jgi:alpha-L-fucosidase